MAMSLLSLLSPTHLAPQRREGGRNAGGALIGKYSAAAAAQYYPDRSRSYHLAKCGRL